MPNKPIRTTDDTIACSYTDPIDVVYTWVDGDDKDWQAMRNKYAIEYQSQLSNVDSNSNNRYRNHDELKYSLRSIHQFASFVHHIYIITNGQRPRWLKDHPKITIVTHEEIFKNKSDLPTFNSHAIEANLHRIPNLSDKFIYFNDDFFLGKQVSPEDFFSITGTIRVYLIPYLAPTGTIIPGEKAYESAWKNTDALLSIYYGKEKRLELAHIPHALTKSLIQEAEHSFPLVFSSVSSHKFRMHSDYTLTNGLIPYFAMYTKKATVHYPDLTMLVMLSADVEKNREQFEMLKEHTYRFFCIEDMENEENEAAARTLQEFFMSYFPKPAPWEEIDGK